jgi:hypothetical protein
MAVHIEMSTVKQNKKNQKNQKNQKKSKNHPKQQKRSSARGAAGPTVSFRRPRAAPGQQVARTGLAMATNVPQKRRVQIIEEDEYVGEVYGSVGFNTTQYSANPGQSSTFAIGSQIASLFNEYEYEMLEFYFTAEVSGYATQGQTGVIILSADYDATDAAPTTKKNVEDTIPHTEPCLPSTSVVLLKLDCATMKRGDAKFVRPGLQPANTDLKTYDCANVYVTTQGNQNTNLIGELHVRYRVKCFEPILPGGAALNGTAGAQLLVTAQSSGEAAGNSTTYVASFLGTQDPVIIANGVGATYASATGIFTLPVGTYLVECDNVSTNSSVALTAGTVGLSTGSSTIATSGAGFPVVDSIAAHNDWSNSLRMVWSTAHFGTLLQMEVSATYSSGTTFNYPNMRLTQL